MEVESWDINQFANTLQKARTFASHYRYKCCCPDCERVAIKSHLLQRHPVLQSITDEQHKLLQFEDNWEDARSGRWDLYAEKTRGINDAMQYKLFCKKHDAELFKDLESRNSIPESKKDCLLLAYRAACSVRLQEEMRMHIYESKMGQEPNEWNEAWLNNSKVFILRMNAVIDNLWKATQGEDDYYVFRMIAMPYIPVVASDCIVDEEDYQRHILDDNSSKPFNYYFVSLIPDNERLLLLLGCDTRHDRDGEYSNIVTNFPADFDLPYQYFVETLWGILLKCHTWCCSPKLAEDAKWKEFFEEYEELKVNSIIK